MKADVVRVVLCPGECVALCYLGIGMNASTPRSIQ